jgi:hypothetical protein
VTSCCVSWCSYLADADDSPPSGSTSTEECWKAAEEYHKATRLYGEVFDSLQHEKSDPKEHEEKLTKLSNTYYAQRMALEKKRQEQNLLDMARAIHS